MLEGPWPCTSFVLCSMTMHELHIIGMLLLVSCMSTRNYLLYFCQVLCRVNPQNSQQKHTTKNFAKFPNHFPLLAMVGVTANSPKSCFNKSHGKGVEGLSTVNSSLYQFIWNENFIDKWYHMGKCMTLSLGRVGKPCPRPWDQSLTQCA